MIGGVPLDFLPFILESNCVCLVKNNETGKNLKLQLDFLDKQAIFFPESDDTILIESMQIKSLCDIAEAFINKNFKGIIIATTKSFKELVPNKLSLIGESISLRQGSEIEREKVINLLLNKGYRRSEIVFEPGEFAVRGGLIDIYPIGEELPLRIDFFANEIESVRAFNPVSQITIKKLERNFSIYPSKLQERTETFENFVSDFPVVAYEIDDNSINVAACITSFVKDGFVDKKAREGKVYHHLPDYLNEVVKDLKSYKLAFIACSSNGSRERIINMLEEIEILSIDSYKNSIIGKIHVIVVPFQIGFTSKDICIISEKAIFGQKVKKQPKKSIASFQNFEIGDLIVHQEHGIGRYIGLEEVIVDKIPHDCLHIEYDAGDKIFLPVENMDLISRYGENTANLDRLGTASWQQRKAKIKNRIQLVAKYLLDTAALRALNKADSFEPIKSDYENFLKLFPYQETDDQQNAINDVLKDLSSTKPMDRLICGDVGFGKTEVALRAAFVVASNGKQVAVVVPTTLLCIQHYKTFKSRFEAIGISVVMLSRMTKDSKKVRESIRDGSAQIVIATHAVLSESFLDLGLLIVDEEHHFGVKQKEKLKALGQSIHVLTLSATPIPRTLQMSLAGVRDLSLISTPPMNRLAIRTFVLEFEENSIKDAIEREYARGGQVLYVSPRIEFLDKMESWISKTLPHIRYGIAHGQMSPSQLEDVMRKFYERKFEVLISTTIVESGIDIPTANTVLIERADLLGLAQLYQIRGRVGRAKTQGYAYLLLDPKTVISDFAKRRLKVIQSLDSLGAGLTLASHDLDIRGAGNLLGEEQSGHIKEVGVELYQKFLQEAILMAQAQNANDSEFKNADLDFIPKIQVGIPVSIPESYISSLAIRLDFYRKIAMFKSDDEIHKFASEMIDRFGKLPIEVNNLFAVVSLKVMCIKLKIQLVDIGVRGIVILCSDNKVAEKILSCKIANTIIKVRPDSKIVLMREDDGIKQHMKFLMNFFKKIIDSNFL